MRLALDRQAWDVSSGDRNIDSGDKRSCVCHICLSSASMIGTRRASAPSLKMIPPRWPTPLPRRPSRERFELRLSVYTTAAASLAELQVAGRGKTQRCFKMIGVDHGVWSKWIIVRVGMTAMPAMSTVSRGVLIMYRQSTHPAVPTGIPRSNIPSHLIQTTPADHVAQ